MKSPDPISVMLADAWVGRYASGPREETATERLVRTIREDRTVALDRALTNLGRGVEAYEADVQVFRADPNMHLRYLDARDEALARHGEELGWEPEPVPDPNPDEDGEQA